ncbi:Gfa-like protein [Hyphomicrobium sp. 1Nfss2.1]
MTGNPFANGGCLCGAVTFTASAPPLLMVQCHCTDCQRVSGGGHLSIARFKRDDIAVSGETKTHSMTADSGNTVTRHFCPSCGSRLFSETTGRPGIIGVVAGAFDSNAWFDPDMVIFKRSQPLWDITTEDVPCYDALPPPT